MSEIKPVDAYRAEKKAIAPDATDIIIKGPKVRGGRVLVICRMSVIDLTNVNKTMRLGYERGGSQFWFRRRPAGTNNYGVSIETELILVGGERPIAMCETPTAGDEIWFFAFGAYGMHF